MTDPSPPPSVGVRTEQTNELGDMRERAALVVKKNDELAHWDAMQARDVPAILTEFVHDRIKAGDTLAAIRTALGIQRATDRSWKKILASLKQGYRVDSTALFSMMMARNEGISKKLHEMIGEAMEHGMDVLTAKGNIVKIKSLTREITGAIDSLNRLQQGTVKVGQDLGVFETAAEKSTGSGGGAGVTIVIKSNVPRPSQAEADAHRAKQREKTNKLIESARVIETTARPVSDGGNAVPKPKA